VPAQTVCLQFFGVAPSGREISWSGAAFFAIDGDKITNLWVLGDIDSENSNLDWGKR
jgi:predicted ester cyclase